MNRPPYRRIEPEDLAGAGAPVIVATFMRSGTHLTIDLIRRHFPPFQSWKRPLESLDHLYFPVDILLPGWEPDDWTIERALNVLHRPARPILKTHFLDPDLANLRATQPAVADWLRDRGTFVYVRRDPRRVIPSLWAFYPEWKPDEAGPLDLAFVSRQLAEWRAHLAAWKARAATLDLQFETILSAPGTVLDQIAAALGETPLRRVPPLPPTLRNRFHSRLMRLFGTGSASTAIVTRTSPPAWNPAWDHLLTPNDLPTG